MFIMRHVDKVLFLIPTLTNLYTCHCRPGSLATGVVITIPSLNQKFHRAFTKSLFL